LLKEELCHGCNSNVTFRIDYNGLAMIYLGDSMATY
jgi:hypothetical protein